jgi:hypothetical protein
MAYIKVEYSGVKLAVHYHYQPYEEEGAEHPGAEEELVIDKITHKSVDIIALMAVSVIEEVGNKTLDALKEAGLIK